MTIMNYMKQMKLEYKNNKFCFRIFTQGILRRQGVLNTSKEPKHVE